MRAKGARLLRIDSHNALSGDGDGVGTLNPEPSSVVGKMGHGAAAPARETHAIAHIHSDAPSLIVPDAHLLFSADFKRSGSDLTLIGPNGQKFIIFDYFRHEKLPDLVAPDGATLSAHLVEKLAGSIAPDQYAQATTPSPAAQVIGKIEKLAGR
jgi:hypothetical protein